jgi:hypothetical protein
LEKVRTLLNRGNLVRKVCAHPGQAETSADVGLSRGSKDV